MGSLNSLGKLAVITGASSGIGFELAKVFARNGYHIVVAAENEELNEKAKALQEFGVEVTPIVTNLATKVGVEELYNKIKMLNKPVDCLALNAGVGVSGEFAKNAIEDELNLINLNITSVVHLSKLILGDMIERNQGKILFTSSIAADAPGPYLAVYSASKAFVQSFAEAIRFEMNDTGKNITITSLQPGATDTNFFARAGMEDTKVGQDENKDDPALVALEGYEALMAGKDHVVAGSFKNKISSASGKIMTETQSAAIQAKSVKPQSLEH